MKNQLYRHRSPVFAALSWLLATSAGISMAKADNFFGNVEQQLGRIIYKDASKVDPTTPDTNGASASSTGTTLDVFWCTGDNRESVRALTASELASSYATLAKSGSLDAPTVFNEIRTRPIDRGAFLSKIELSEKDLAQNNTIFRFDSSDKSLLGISNELIAKGIQTAVISPATTSTYMPNYISVYVCSDVDAGALTGRLFFQVKDAGQMPIAQKATAELNTQIPGLVVARGIEVVGEKSPDKSEVRYFFANDAALANLVAKGISSTTTTAVHPKQVKGFEGKVRPGTLEAWISE